MGEPTVTRKLEKRLQGGVESKEQRAQALRERFVQVQLDRLFPTAADAEPSQARAAAAYILAKLFNDFFYSTLNAECNRGLGEVFDSLYPKGAQQREQHQDHIYAELAVHGIEFSVTNGRLHFTIRPDWLEYFKNKSGETQVAPLKTMIRYWLESIVRVTALRPAELAPTQPGNQATSPWLPPDTGSYLLAQMAWEQHEGEVDITQPVDLPCDARSVFGGSQNETLIAAETAVMNCMTAVQQAIAEWPKAQAARQQAEREQLQTARQDLAQTKEDPYQQFEQMNKQAEYNLKTAKSNLKDAVKDAKRKDSHATSQRPYNKFYDVFEGITNVPVLLAYSILESFFQKTIAPQNDRRTSNTYTGLPDTFYEDNGYNFVNFIGYLKIQYPSFEKDCATLMPAIEKIKSCMKTKSALNLATQNLTAAERYLLAIGQGEVVREQAFDVFLASNDDMKRASYGSVIQVDSAEKLQTLTATLRSQPEPLATIIAPVLARLDTIGKALQAVAAADQADHTGKTLLRQLDRALGANAVTTNYAIVLQHLTEASQQLPGNEQLAEAAKNLQKNITQRHQERINTVRRFLTDTRNTYYKLYWIINITLQDLPPDRRPSPDSLLLQCGDEPLTFADVGMFQDGKFHPPLSLLRDMRSTFSALDSDLAEYVQKNKLPFESRPILLSEQLAVEETRRAAAEYALAAARHQLESLGHQIRDLQAELATVQQQAETERNVAASTIDQQQITIEQMIDAHTKINNEARQRIKTLEAQVAAVQAAFTILEQAITQSGVFGSQTRQAALVAFKKTVT